MKKEDVNKPLIYKGIKAIKNLIKFGNFTSKKYWDNQFKEYGEHWRNMHNSSYPPFFELLPNKKFTILDVGCAMGEGCELIQKKFPLAEITGIDISDVAIRRARERNKNIKYICLDVRKEPLPNRKWDCILLIDVLEHFKNPFKILNKCLKHIKCFIIVRVPFKQVLYFKFLREHKYHFDENTFKGYNSKLIKIVEDPIYPGKYAIYQVLKNSNNSGNEIIRSIPNNFHKCHFLKRRDKPR